MEQYTTRIDSMEFSTIVENLGVVQNKTFNTISFQNTYQNRTEHSFLDFAKKRFRKYIYNNMRDNSNGRLFDNHLKVILKFSGVNRDIIKISDVVTNYMPINVR